jgi:hypothetical protein
MMEGNGLTAEMVKEAADEMAKLGLEFSGDIGARIASASFASGNFRKEIEGTDNGLWIVKYGDGKRSQPMSWSDAMAFIAGIHSE